jgi:hypothetical protein
MSACDISFWRAFALTAVSGLGMLVTLTSDLP